MEIQEGVEVVKRGRGRPPGSKNKPKPPTPPAKHSKPQVKARANAVSDVDFPGTSLTYALEDGEVVMSMTVQVSRKE